MAGGERRSASRGLEARNITIGGRRTSMRLEPQMWEALHEIARREGCSVHDICEHVAAHRGASSLTAATRVFILGYFRSAATPSGHATAGHGTFDGETGGPSSGG